KTDNLETNIALPEKSGGTGKGANPKEILTSSAAACYVMTLVSVIETSALAIEQLQMETVINDLKDNEFEIVHCPQLTLSDNATVSYLIYICRLLCVALLYKHFFTS